MPSLLILFFMIFFLLESTVAIVENGFIIVVLSREWMRCSTLPHGDMILASLSISRFFLQWAAVLNDFFTYFSPSDGSLYLDIFWNFTNTTTFWLTTWLAVFYCVKISSFTHPIFLWLKWRISRCVPQLLLWSLLISTLIIISYFVKTYPILQPPVTGNYSEKTTLEDMRRKLHMHFFLPLQMFILLIPFLFFLVSIILLISSLYRHLGNMQHHSACPQDQSMQVHITTVKSFFFFLILCTSYVLPLIITLITVYPFSVCSSRFWVWEVLTYASLSIHPAFLILNNSKLRRALKKMLHNPEAA
ncbi:taste receptor type 2 member 134-like [Phascolarctos cinereus]|uniref:Taste receptor type 2 n=1 Tax=Phascolarctos cinereus TaxID=38626 RepID=A0A6P5L6Q7_PHACI|nr:taste receptor type 2 member 134-like [Phascolarctos cinereus]BDF92178.1 taste receptor type 2 member 705 [Phascolarctos cinereus]